MLLSDRILDHSLAEGVQAVWGRINTKDLRLFFTNLILKKVWPRCERLIKQSVTIWLKHSVFTGITFTDYRVLVLKLLSS